MGEYGRNKTLSTFLYSSWERGRINLIFSTDLAGDMNYLMKQFPSLYVSCKHGYIRRCLVFFQCMGEYRRNKTLSTFLYISWERGRVNLIISPDIAGDMDYLMKQFPSLYMFPVSIATYRDS